LQVVAEAEAIAEAGVELEDIELLFLVEQNLH
jgi:hypothetical protein